MCDVSGQLLADQGGKCKVGLLLEFVIDDRSDCRSGEFVSLPDPQRLGNIVGVADSFQRLNGVEIVSQDGNGCGPTCLDKICKVSQEARVRHDDGQVFGRENIFDRCSREN